MWGEGGSSVQCKGPKIFRIERKTLLQGSRWSFLVKTHVLMPTSIFHPRWEHRVLLPGQEFLAGEIKVSLLARFFLERSQPAALGWCWHVDAPCPGSALAAAPNLKDLLQGSGFGSVRFGAVAVSGRGGCS